MKILLQKLFNFVGLLVLLTFSWPGLAQSTKMKNEKQIEALLNRVFFPSKEGAMADSKFMASGCHVPTAKWVKLLGFGQPFEHEFQFQENCDLKGTLKATKEPFWVEFDLRNFGEFKKIKFKAEPAFVLNEKKQMFDLKIKSRNAELFRDKGSIVLFDFNYSSELDIAGRGNLNPKLVVKVK